MNILLTNDDGYNSTGIELLKRKLQKFGHVFVCAPYTHMSAKSCSITIYEPIHIKVEDKDLVSIDGTPADCVAFGLIYFKEKIDIVVSGCNNGFNISYDTMYSGTIGACLQAIVHDIPAIAISCNGNFEIVDNYFDKVMDFVLTNKLLSTNYLLNINFPLGEKVNSIQLGKLYIRHDNGYYVKKGDEYHVIRDTEKNFQDKESDCYQVNNGIVSIVPLNNSYFSEIHYNNLKKKLSK